MLTKQCHIIQCFGQEISRAIRLMLYYQVAAVTDRYSTGRQQIGIHTID